ncbi:hypothetical protein [Ornithinimicrobium sp. Y1694]|uniref:hypothetical protein n=1 Tax=Ornithinimicrobium sp. Y1694 TaxID=3418590 RepID=UPI003CE6C6B6
MTSPVSFEPTDPTHDFTDVSVSDPADSKPALNPRTIGLSALALGALALPDPARLSPGQRHLLRLARAGFVGWYAWDLTRRTEGWPPVSPEFLGAAGGAAVTLATAPLDEATDAWADRTLRRFGIDNPRPVIAGLAALMGAGLAADAQSRPAVADAWVPVDDVFESIELPGYARSLIEKMLDSAPVEFTPAATALRAQLDVATASTLVDQESTDVFLQVPDDAPRTVPHGLTWPVRGHFELGEIPVQLELSIGDGHMVGLNIMMRDAYLADDDPRWEVDLLEHLDAWPTPDQVSWVVETSQGLQPVD